ncbi:MAG: Gfo/Idh/MocA family oxidoreductase, partial [Candidatus Omnitrophica bacterium]|nr:Gfo/Idh/MocA family oxidoreductase [Candidatus Omnitrophota bacterium]
MKNQTQSTRRDFIKTTAASTAAVSLPWIIPSSALGKDGAVAPSERITLGVIGIGPRCRYVLGGMLPQPDLQCVAIADVQASRRDEGKKLVDEHYGNQDLVLYHDFREVLDRKDIDAVLIATGDRWHTTASILAAEAGKDVYSEKPCGLTIAYCQELDEAIQRTGRVFQAGTQRRSVANFRQAVELAHSGKLGKIHTLHATVYT